MSLKEIIDLLEIINTEKNNQLLYGEGLDILLLTLVFFPDFQREVTVFSNFEAIQNETIQKFYECCRRCTQLWEVPF